MKTWCAVVVVLALGASLPSSAQPPSGDPARKSPAALAEDLRSPDHEVSAVACEALTKLGAEAVPALVKGLRPAGTRQRLLILQALAGIGPAASDAVPVVSGCIMPGRFPPPRNPDLWAPENAYCVSPAPWEPTAAALTLASLGPRGLEALVALAKGAWTEPEIAALGAGLAACGPEAIPSVTPLLQPENTHPSAPHVAYRALVAMGPSGLDALRAAPGGQPWLPPGLVARLDPAVFDALMDWGIAAQGDMQWAFTLAWGNPPQVALPAVARLYARKPSPAAMNAFGWAVWRDPWVGLPRVRQMLDSADGPTRALAAAALPGHRLQGASWESALRRLLRDPDPKLRFLGAVAACGNVALSRSLAEDLERMAGTESGDNQTAADLALACLAPRSGWDVDKVRQLARTRVDWTADESAEPRWRLSAAATSALSHMGPAGLDALRDDLRHASEGQRTTLAIALASLGSAEVDALCEAAVSPMGLGPESVSVTLGCPLWPDEALLELARLAAKHEDGRVRALAAAALAGIPRVPPPAVDYLLEALHDEDTTVRAHSAVALARIGEAARDAIPALKNRLPRGPMKERAAVAWALRQLGEPEGRAFLLNADDMHGVDSGGWAAPMVWRDPSLPLTAKSPHDGVGALVADFDRETADVAPMLVRMASDSERAVRERAAVSLAQLREPREVVFPALLASPETIVMSMMGVTLQPCAAALRDAGWAAVPCVLDALRRAPTTQADGVVHVLELIGSVPGDCLADLNALVADRACTARERLVPVLVRSMDPAGLSGLLTPHLADPSLATAIGKGLQGLPDRGAALVMHWLGSGDSKVRYSACRVAAGIGQPADPRVVDALRGLTVEEPLPVVEAMARGALQQLGEAAPGEPSRRAR